MNLKSLSIPDSLPELAHWLDDLLVSADLLDTILELEVLAGDRLTDIQTLDGILVEAQDSVITADLAQAQESTVRSFLRQPSLLLELQELVMMHGGAYWRNKADAAFGTPRMAIDRGKDISTANPKTHSTSIANSGWSQAQKMAGVIAALAAAVLIMFSISQLGGGDSSVAVAKWGFAKSGLLETSMPESEMLDRLASASASWHNKVPANAEQLEKRLREFDFGCQTLLNSRPIWQ